MNLRTSGSVGRFFGWSALMFAVTVPVLAADTAKGIELYEQREYESAAAELRGVLEAEPAHREARYYLALSEIGLERYDEAIDGLRQLSTEESEEPPSGARVRAGLARALMGKKQYDEAGKVLDAAVTMNPKDDEVRVRRAELALHRKDYSAAVKESEDVLGRKPDNAYAHYYAGIAYSNLRRPDKMADHFQKFLKLAPDAPEADKVQSLLRSLRR